MDKLFKKLGVIPNESRLYMIAFSHSSYANENNLKSDYERLEFLGDAVLEIIVSDYLYKNLNVEEGDMTKLRASYVCENACFTYATDLGFSNYIKVGHGEAKEGGQFKKVIVADIFEAFTGALYLDQGFEKTKEVISSIIVPYIEDPNVIFFSDYKSALQESIQTEKRTLEYVLVDEQGPAHNKTFTMIVKVDDIVYGRGIAGSKKEAEQEAAKDALAKLAIKN
ncbi:MAG: ribonuclease III [Firmicutes bacterium]|nr:ribonuclease III [Bacillota bacterium]